MSSRSFLFTAVLLAHVTASSADPAVAAKPGGWSEISVSDAGVVAAAAFAVQAKQAALGEGGSPRKLSLDKIDAAEQQVVQGMNYRLTLRVLDEGTGRTAEAVVWARVWLEEDDRYQLTSWRFTDAPPKADRSPR
jgi:hypothetical protein